jgi:indole-3-glycerol phosphate synthase
MISTTAGTASAARPQCAATVQPRRVGATAVAPADDAGPPEFAEPAEFAESDAAAGAPAAESPTTIARCPPDAAGVDHTSSSAAAAAAIRRPPARCLAGEFGVAPEVPFSQFSSFPSAMTRDVPNMLRQIMDHKRAELRERVAAEPLEALKEKIEELGRPRNFFGAVTRRPKGDAADAYTAVIAEIKRKSPSEGWMREEYADDDAFDPAAVATAYEAAGAKALSCLTDERFFAGRLDYIHRVRDACGLPVLRKDFIIDPYQVWESRAYGADAVLLIAECLREAELVDLMILAHELELTVLLETHSMDNLLRVRPHVGFPKASYTLLGVNNRDLSSMTTDLGHTLRMVDWVDDPSILVSESGIETPADLAKLRAAGVHIVLVGTSLMKQRDPGAALSALLGGGA